MRSPTHRQASYGFTLIELMIVCAVVAILAAVAYPSYRDSVLKGRRAQARTALLDLMQQQERYMTQNNTYYKFTTAADGSATFKVYAGDDAVNPSYWLTAQECTNPGGGTFGMRDCVKLSAAPTLADVAVGTLTLTSTGVKDCEGTTTNKRLCWP